MCLNSEKGRAFPRWPVTFSRWWGKWIQFDDWHIFQMGLGKKHPQADLTNLTNNFSTRNTVSTCLKGNTSSIRVPFPASFVSLPECIWQISQQGWSWLGNYQCWFEIASWQQHVGKDVLWPKLARDRKRKYATKNLQIGGFFVREIPGKISGKSRWAKYYHLALGPA